MPNPLVSSDYKALAMFHPEATATLVRVERACAVLAEIVKRGDVTVSEIDPILAALDAITELATHR